MITKEFFTKENIYRETLQQKIEELDWTKICSEYVLTEDMLQQYKEYVDWEAVSLYQNMSFTYIIKNFPRLHVANLKQNEQLQLSTKQWSCIKKYTKNIDAINQSIHKKFQKEKKAK